MNLHDTIFALSSASGKAGIAVIRISGAAVSTLFGTVIPHPLPQARQVVYTPVVDPQSQETIDVGLCIFFQAPQSFTGEDVLELHLHGSIAILRKLFDVLCKIPNFRPAEAGEFSRRGFLHDKFDLTQAESLIDLIDAETEQQRRAALANTRGALFELYSGWRESIQELCAYCEASLDFPDEELPSDLESHIFSRSQVLYDIIQAHIATAPQGTRLRLGTKIAIIGPSNAGKSSLLNYFARTQAAITSPIAGTTRDSIEQHIDIAGYAVKLVDTAGLQSTDDLIEQEGIRRTHEQAEIADLILLMFDGSQKIPSMDYKSIVDNKNIIIVINKLDQGFDSMNDVIITKNFSNIPCINISLKHHTGLDQLQEILKNSLENLAGNNHAPLVMHARYQQALENSLQKLSCVIKIIAKTTTIPDSEKNIEIIAEELRSARHALDRILGHRDVEDVLEMIFSRFCLGK